MLNKEKYAKDIVELAVNNETIALKYNKPISCMKIKCDDCERHTNLGCFNHILTKWANSEYKDPILDEVEKRYLRGVIRPFKKEVKIICKLSYVFEQIVIQMQSGIEIKLPCFKKGTMYQGMEENRRYTIEELGL